MYNRALNPVIAGLVSGLLSLPVVAAELDWGVDNHRRSSPITRPG